MSVPLQSGSIGELFWRVSEAVVLVDGDRVVAWNPSAQRTFGIAPECPADAADVLAPVLGSSYGELQRLFREPGTAVIDATAACGLVLDVKSWPVEDSDMRMLVITDVTAGHRLSDGLTRLSALGRELLVSEPELPDLLQQLVDEAKSVTRADYSAMLLLQPEHTDAVSHFVYNAPADLVPDRVPRVVGLLALPLSERTAISVDDVRRHPSRSDVPARHPPIGPLLAVPVFAGDVISGEILVANAPGGFTFDNVDKQLLLDLAAHAGIAVRWAESRERARAMHDIRNEIVATARHDIRNPLTIGSGYASMLQQKRDRMSPEQIDAALNAIRSAFERIEQFATRALIDDDDEPTSPTPDWKQIAVRPLLRSIAVDHTPVARDAGARITTCAEPGTPEHFVADAGMVREVLDNLVTNAIKYGAAGDAVTITARGVSDQVRFDVHNSGDGIALQDQQHIFEPYWRTETARASATPGTGLGLAIVRRLVTMHGGVVGVTSRPDAGTTFWVTFPVVGPDDGHEGSA